MDCVRDSAFGRIVRLLSRRRLLQYPEEADPDAWKRYVKSDEHIAKINSKGSYGYALDTVISQASRRRILSRTISTALSGSPIDEEKKQLPLAGSETQSLPPISDQTKVVGWDGDDDPENPFNWSIHKKLLVSSQVWLLTFAVYIGSAIYSPGIPLLAHDFGVSNVAATLGLTLFVLGYGFGPMIWSPLSELPSVGRAPVYVATLFFFVFLNFGVIYATNFGMFLAFRFITGFIGSPALATGGASMGDVWGPITRDYMIGMWGAFAVCAPVLGPLIGGFASMAKGWTWTIWPLMWLSGFALIILFFFLPETFSPNILARRAQRIRQITGDPEYRSESEIASANTKKSDIVFEALVRPFVLCFGEPIVFFLNLYIALIYGILYIWFEAFPIVFEIKRGFNPGEGGCAFLGILISTVLLALPVYFYWKAKYQIKYFDEVGDIVPEKQLPPACVGSICLAVSMFWFGWTGNYASVHWIVPILASMLFAFGGTLIFNCVFNFLGCAYPQFAASVLAGNDFMRSTVGAGFPLFATAMFNNLGVEWACTLLGCLCLLFIPYPFILIKYGKRLRLASKYARHDI